MNLVSANEDQVDCSNEELARRCQSLAKSNAALRREYDSMVQEKSASLATLRHQIAEMAQQELEESQSATAASDATLQQELSDLKATVDFLQREIDVAQAALKESESRLFASQATSLHVAATQHSMLVYERSLEAVQDKFVKECETAADFKLRLQESEENCQRRDARIVELGLQLRRCIAENELDAHAHAQKLDLFEQMTSRFQVAAQKQQFELDRLHYVANEDAATLALERDKNRVLREQCQALEGSVQEHASKLQRQQQEMDQLEELAAQYNVQHTAALDQEQDKTRIAQERCQQLEDRLQECQLKLQKEIDQLEELISQSNSQHAAVLVQEYRVRDENRVLREQCQTLEGSVQEHASKLQRQQQEMDQLEELVAQYNIQHTAALDQEQDKTRIAQERCQQLDGLLKACQLKLQNEMQACADLTALLLQKEEVTASNGIQMRELATKLQQAESWSQRSKDETAELGRQFSQAVLRSSALQQQNDVLVASSKELAAHARDLEAKITSSAPLQAARSGYERSLRDVKYELHERFRASKLFASAYVSNCLDALFFATTAVFFMKWRLAVVVSSDSDKDSDFARASLQRVASEHRGRPQFELSNIERYHRRITANGGDETNSHNLSLSGAQHPVVSSNLTVSPHNTLPSGSALSDDVYLNMSEVLQLLSDSGLELTATSSDLQAHAADLQSLATSAATVINESPVQNNALVQALVLYLRSISQCESRLHDMNFPLFACTQNLHDASGSLSAAQNESPEPFSFSSLLDIASQMTDASLAIERAVRNTEPFSIELRSLLDASSMSDGVIASSRHHQQQQATSSRLAAVRSSINHVLGAVLSCSNRIASCADVAAACCDHLQRHHETLADNTRVLRRAAGVWVSRGPREGTGHSDEYQEATEQKEKRAGSRLQ